VATVKMRPEVISNDRRARSRQRLPHGCADPWV